MADLLYDYGLDEWREWDSGTYTWLALKSTYTPSRTHHFIADVVADEVTVAGYSRSPVSAPTRTVDTTLHRITYNCDDPNFGEPVAGETVGYVALAREVTDDADSVMLALYDISDFATNGGEIVPVVAATGVHYVDQT
jgi:hypothetical protein